MFKCCYLVLTDCTLSVHSVVLILLLIFITETAESEMISCYATKSIT